MSGITPILDTLLHQVLGKRVDHAPPRDLNEPVRPLNAADATRALHSDSRLDGRRPPIADLAPAAQRGEGRPVAPREAAPPAAGSFQTHFSPAARTIADLLIRFPAPPSAVRPPAPLVPEGQVPGGETLAQRLEGSIRHSGLFHESHLARWYRGELPRAALVQEPQQWRILSFRPTEAPPPLAPWRPSPAAPPGPGSGAERGAATPPAASPPAVTPPFLPPSASRLAGAELQALSQGRAPLVPASPSAAPPGPGSGAERGAATPPAVSPPAVTPPFLPSSASRLAGAELQALSQGRAPLVPASPSTAPPGQTRSVPPGGQAPPVAQVQQAAAQGEVAEPGEEQRREPLAVRTGEPVAESLQGLLRHQLELLVNPVVRWEGDVWSGIFMALMIQLPAGYEERARQEAEGEEGGGETWASELTLVLPGLGELAVRLHLVARRLNLTLDSGDAAVVARLEAGLPRLAERLEALGFEARLAARHRPAEEAS